MLHRDEDQQKHAAEQPAGNASSPDENGIFRRKIAIVPKISIALHREA